MIGFKTSGGDSREKGNPETKNHYSWIPASGGMMIKGDMVHFVLLYLSVL